MGMQSDVWQQGREGGRSGDAVRRMATGKVRW